MPTENQRERDLRRYYQPWLDARSLVGAARDEHDDDNDDSVNALTYKGYKPTSSKDKALTAFAQLATLRLNVRRAMVSLVDSKQQYILAEATKTLSLVTDTALDQKDQIWLGNAVLERSVTVCGHTFGSQYTATDENGHTLTAEALVIPDMRLDTRFKDRAYVKAKPGVLFYAGVPIRTRAGHNIGVYAVSSDEPRFGLTVDELQFMIDVAATVMLHLEMSKAVDDRYKGERMVRGLAKFIEGWDVPESVNSPGGISSFSEGYPNSDYTTNTATLARQTENAHLEDDDVETLKKSKNRPGPLSRHHTPEHTSTEKDESENISNIYSRASRIIRESILADGVIIFRTMTGVEIQEREPNFQPTSDISDTSDSGFSSANQGHARLRRTRLTKDSNQRTSNPTDLSGTSASESHKLCEVLGWAVDYSNSELGLKKEDLMFPEPSMERYIKRYPHGKYFNFSESGSGVSSDEKSESDSPAIVASQMHDVQQKPKTKSKSKRTSLIPTEILKFLPGLRSLIFLPLWDVANDKWSAGAFIWSFNSARLMSPTHELPFLKAFGNSIMSEVARLNAQKADRAKSTFIASVSHELRSPLHGILGSVEFLQDTQMSGYQQGLVNSVEACGKTLLDTIDHVLDYAKINRLRGAGSRRKQQIANVLSNSVIGTDAEFDLSELVEEVVETVAAGHSFRKSRNSVSLEGDRISAEGKPHDPSNTTKITPQDAVDIILDISTHTGWTVCTQPGAIRRVVMNLLGNALKYTPTGFVSVLLKPSPSQLNDTHLDLILCFVDSGKGMSLEYQRTRLFAPFSQEDPFAAGTGLGLSIVRQIIESLKGSIIIKSTKNVGTEVEVSLSLPLVSEKRGNAGKINSPVANQIEALLSSRKRGSSSTRVATSIRQTCENWFNAHMTETQNLTGTSGDVLIIVEESNSVDSLLDAYIASERIAPLIIIAHDKAREITLKAKIHQVASLTHMLILPISQPCGPFKICEVLRKVKSHLQSAMNKPPLLRATSTPSPAQSNIKTPLPNILAYSFGDLQTAIETPRSSASHIVNPASAVVSPRSSTPVPGFEPVTLPPPNVRAQGPDARPMVLLVDDNTINLSLLVMFMKKCGYPYASATNGLVALKEYQAASRTNSPSAKTEAADTPTYTAMTNRSITHILMDVSMPVMDGFEATRQIRKFEKAHGLTPAKIIALTGLASQQAQEEASASGVDAYLAKPVKFKELRKMLDETK